MSVKSDYAARALLSLARAHPTGRARRVEELAGQQGIPASYLVQILLELKAKNLVRSQRGKAGGYLLARPPAEISLGQLLRAMHGQVLDAPILADPHCPAELRFAWESLRRRLEQAADGISLQDLLDHGDDKAKMYYI